MTRTIKLALLSVICVASYLFAVTDVKADTITFSNVVALQNNSATRIDLFSNPGATVFGPRLTFMVDISGSVPSGSSSLLQITYTEAGSAPNVQTFLIPAFGSVSPPYTQLFTIASNGASYEGTAATLTVSVINSPGFSVGADTAQGFISHSYSFRVAQPVPEPTTMVLLGGGMLGLWAKARWRRGRSQAKD